MGRSDSCPPYANLPEGRADWLEVVLRGDGVYRCDDLQAAAAADGAGADIKALADMGFRTLRAFALTEHVADELRVDGALVAVCAQGAFSALEEHYLYYCASVLSLMRPRFRAS